MEVLELMFGVRLDCSVAITALSKGRVRSQVAVVEALRLRFELFLLALSVSSPTS